MPYGPPQPSCVRLSFSASKGAVSEVSGRFRLGSSGGVAQLVDGRDSLPIELGARFKLLEQFRVLAHMATCPDVLAFNDWAFRACLIDMLDCPHCDSGLEKTALHAFYNCEQVWPFWSHIEEWTARIIPKQCTMLTLRIRVRSMWCFSQP